jgi:glyoxylase-like metal-dependent hydrolase (beta-lactamase superfamily II)
MLVVRQAVVGPFAENTYLAACSRSREAVLVDPGGELDRVLPLAERDGFRIGRVLLTHGHVDHVAGVAEARRRLGVPVHMHPADRPWLETVSRQAEMYGFEEAVEVPEVDAWLADGEQLTVGELRVRVIHTPGHTPGSCSFYFAEAATLLTGDTLFAGSVGRTDLPGGDFEALRHSIVDRLFPLGDQVTFHPGHGPAARLGAERLSNPFVGEGVRRGRFV